MNEQIPHVKIGAASIPQIGFGTWQLMDDVLANAVEAAVNAGYRHFDTAARYENEIELGTALRASKLVRDDYFLTTKVWYTEATTDAFRKAAEQSLERLNVGPVDLLLFHWPSPDVPLADTIRALSAAKADGLAHHIGVSNFPIALLDRAIELADTPIITNQCECHAYFQQNALRKHCAEKNVAFTAYSPIGRGTQAQDPVLQSIAQAHGKSVPQILLRWHLQLGNIAIPRSSNPGRIRENIAITDFTLTPDDMAKIATLDKKDGRTTSPEWVSSWD